MKNKITKLGLVLLLMFSASCSKDDVPVAPQLNNNPSTPTTPIDNNCDVKFRVVKIYRPNSLNDTISDATTIYHIENVPTTYYGDGVMIVLPPNFTCNHTDVSSGDGVDNNKYFVYRDSR